MASASLAPHHPPDHHGMDNSHPSFSLVIKSANRHSDDQTVLARRDWTVWDLKSHLTKCYPTHPPVEEQKLIYAGRLLPNHSHLEEVLRGTVPADSPGYHAHDHYTLHLVCKRDTLPVTATTPAAASSSSSQPSTSSGSSGRPIVNPLHCPTPVSTIAGMRSFAASVNASSSSEPNKEDEALRRKVEEDIKHFNLSSSQVQDYARKMQAYYQQYYQYYWYCWAYHQQQQAQAQSATASPTASSDAAESGEILRMRTMAAAVNAGLWPRGMESPFPMAPPSAVGGVAPPPPSPAATDPSLTSPPPDAQPVTEPAAGVPEAEAPLDGPQVQPQQMDAQGGFVDADDDDDGFGVGGQRDILDWLYLTARLTVLFSIVYFYSNATRFAVVLILGVFLYAIQGMGRERRERERYGDEEVMVESKGRLAQAAAEAEARRLARENNNERRPEGEEQGADGSPPAVDGERTEDEEVGGGEDSDGGMELRRRRDQQEAPASAPSEVATASPSSAATASPSPPAPTGPSRAEQVVLGAWAFVSGLFTSLFPDLTDQ
ncbi:unnamed protein product [Cyprideis torosa]|uniref:Uncharacterized protein n=2 Tax=Cyprideis torosa TaxID=163714 RepID=A0A7R8WK31_9CRUS|nr:unnamed protein product [Cyprideis torosa]CAG0900892.1 unnamed protein product [Cyprideis torosa]